MATFRIFSLIVRCLIFMRSQIFHINIFRRIIAVGSFDSSLNTVFMFVNPASFLSAIIAGSECRVGSPNSTMNPRVRFLGDEAEEKE